MAMFNFDLIEILYPFLYLPVLAYPIKAPGDLLLQPRPAAKSPSRPSV